MRVQKRPRPAGAGPDGLRWFFRREGHEVGGGAAAPALGAPGAAGLGELAEPAVHRELIIRIVERQIADDAAGNSGRLSESMIEDLSRRMTISSCAAGEGGTPRAKRAGSRISNSAVNGSG